jgi:hypothetical protein
MPDRDLMKTYTVSTRRPLERSPVMALASRHWTSCPDARLILGAYGGEPGSRLDNRETKSEPGAQGLARNALIPVVGKELAADRRPWWVLARTTGALWTGIHRRRAGGTLRTLSLLTFALFLGRGRAYPQDTKRPPEGSQDRPATRARAGQGASNGIERWSVHGALLIEPTTRHRPVVVAAV